MAHKSETVKSRVLGARLGKWVGPEIQPKAEELGLSWETLRRWIAGETFPRKLDLVGLALYTGVPLDEWQRLLATDLAARFPVRIDTVEQAAAAVADMMSNPPATTGQDGAATDAGAVAHDDQHVAQDVA